MAVSREEIESLGYIPLGSGWFRNVFDTYRIRKWSGDEIDIWAWSYDDDCCITIFRGNIYNLDELKFITERVIIK